MPDDYSTRGERNIAIYENEKKASAHVVTMRCLACSGQKHGSTGSLVFDHSTVRRDLLEAFLELNFFEQQIGNQSAETRVLNP
jgi:hypothetical protein